LTTYNQRTKTTNPVRAQRSEHRIRPGRRHGIFSSASLLSFLYIAV
jgi:hypothetical protein